MSDYSTDECTRININLLLLASMILYSHNLPSLENKSTKINPICNTKKTNNINKVESNNKIPKKKNERDTKKKKILSIKNNNIYAKVYNKRCRKYMHSSQYMLSA